LAGILLLKLWRQQGLAVQETKNENFFINMLTPDTICGMIATAWTITCCGDADAAAEAPPRLTSSLMLLCGRVSEYYPPRIRKEAISWKTLFLGVANVVKVIWFRFRISVARELPLSTRPGSAQIPLACTI